MLLIYLWFNALMYLVLGVWCTDLTRRTPILRSR